MRKYALIIFGLVVTSLVALGLIVLASASEPNALKMPMCHGDMYYFIKRQALYVAAGAVIAVAMAKVDYRFWKNHPLLTFLFAGAVLVLLCVVFLFPAVKGSQRWLPLGPVRLQPSELAKLAVVIWLAAWLDRVGPRVETLKYGAIIPALFLGAMVAPVALEPDFGSSLVIICAASVVMLLAGVRVWHLVMIAFSGVFILGILVAFNPNRMARIAAFVGIDINVGAKVAAHATHAAEYQAYNSLVAISNGGIWGQGLNQSMQKNFYLPEAHTDFILAIGAEELGIFFSIGVLLLFTLFFIFAVNIARNSVDRFGRYLVMGMTFLIFGQAMANVGVVCEALPTKGLALPFFSYGGTNMLCTLFAVGMIMSVGVHSYLDHKRKVPYE